MKIVYQGAHPDVTVEEDGRELVYAERGVPVDVPDDLGTRLLEQDTWESALAPKTRAKTPTTDGDSK